MADELDVADAQGEDTHQEAVTKLMNIGGREVLCRFLTEAQFMQMAYEAQVLGSDKIPDTRKIKTLTRMFRIMRSIIVDDDDKDYIEDLMADGTINMSDLLAVIKELNEAGTTKSTAKVRRGPARSR